MMIFLFIFSELIFYILNSICICYFIASYLCFYMHWLNLEFIYFLYMFIIITVVALYLFLQLFDFFIF